MVRGVREHQAGTLAVEPRGLVPQVESRVVRSAGAGLNEGDGPAGLEVGLGFAPETPGRVFLRAKSGGKAGEETEADQGHG
jgi:hypothetical protein